MRAFRIGHGSATGVERRGPIGLLAVLGLFATAVYALLSTGAADTTDASPATLAMLLVGFVVLVGSLRTRRR